MLFEHILMYSSKMFSTMNLFAASLPAQDIDHLGQKMAPNLCGLGGILRDRVTGFEAW